MEAVRIHLFKWTGFKSPCSCGYLISWKFNARTETSMAPIVARGSLPWGIP